MADLDQIWARSARKMFTGSTETTETPPYPRTFVCPHTTPTTSTLPLPNNTVGRGEHQAGVVQGSVFSVDSVAISLSRPLNPTTVVEEV